MRVSDFFLGTHKTQWLFDARFAEVPLFISARRLRERKRMRRAATRWALDSGGFSELSMFGEWRTSPEQYAGEAAHWSDEIGRLDWIAPQDWMCEPWITNKTGLTVADHQRLTIDSVLTLRRLAPTVHVIPVLQGWAYDDYMSHATQYEAAGIDLTRERVVGVGSVCRRQDTTMAEHMLSTLASRGVKAHGFGFKRLGLRRSSSSLFSADSMAWSFRARRSEPLAGCSHGKGGLGKCANCALFALAWLERVKGDIMRGSSQRQLTLGLS